MVVAILLNDFFARFVQHLDPVGDEAAFAWSRVLQFLRERGAAAAAATVPHDHDFGDFQHLDGEFKRCRDAVASGRSEEHTSELQSLMRISYAVFCLKKKTKSKTIQHIT